MIHDRAAPLLIDLAYGELSPDEARELERHVSECRTCAAELRQLLETRRLAATLPDEPPPSRGREALREMARRACPPPPVSAARRRVRAYAIAASAAIVLVVAGVTLRWTGDPRPGGARTDAAAQRDAAPVQGEAASEQPGVPPVAAAPPLERRPEARPPPAPSRSPPARSPAAAPVPNPPAPSAVASAPAPSAALDAAPSRRSAPAAARGAAPAAAASGVDRSEPPGAVAAGARSIVEDVERRAAAGELAEDAHQLVCGSETIERVTLREGDRVVKVTVRDGRGIVHEGWYDRAGRLRATRRQGSAVVPLGGGIPADPWPLPVQAPATAAPSECP